jgi:hypothetical protein
MRPGSVHGRIPCPVRDGLAIPEAGIGMCPSPRQVASTGAGTNYLPRWLSLLADRA